MKKILFKNDAGEWPWVEIFKVGIWNGVEATYDLLQSMVRNFRPDEVGVPMFIGHIDWWSSEEKPALGWIEALELRGDSLWAKPRAVSEKLVEAVNSEEFPRRSIEYYDNWRGRGPMLSGIAFIGASTPAVDGLAPVAFACEAKPIRLVAAASPAADDAKSLKNQKPGEDGGDNMDRAELQKLIDEQVQRALSAETPNIIKTFKATDEFKALEAKAAEADTLRKQMADEALERRKKGAKAFVERLVKEKRMTPAQTQGLEEEILGLSEEAAEKYMARIEATAPGVNKALFKEIGDGDGEETAQARTRVARFAAQFGLDASAVESNMKAMKSSRRDETDDDETDDEGRDMMTSGVCYSLTAMQPKKKAA